MQSVFSPELDVQLTSTSSDHPVVVGRALTGTIGYWQAAPESASVEIGYEILSPMYQHAFVFTHASGLLLQYTLEPPGRESQSLSGGGGLGLRRVQCQAHANNSASIRAIERLGLKLEGTIRCVSRFNMDCDSLAFCAGLAHTIDTYMLVISRIDGKELWTLEKTLIVLERATP